MANLQKYVDLIRDCCPELDVRSVTPIPEGWDSFVLEINRDLIFRFPRHPQAEEKYEMEKLLLAELSSVLSVKVPNIEFDCRVEGHEFGRFIGYQKIIGEPLSKNRLNPPNDELLSNQLTEVLSQTHRFPVSKAVMAHVPLFSAAEWRDEYRQLYRSIQDNAFEMLPESSRRYTAAVWENYLEDDANFEFDPVVVHRDLGREHILCDHERSAVTGIIDWADAAIGDPAIDFVGILIECGRKFTAKVASSYFADLGESFWNRAEFYREVGPYHEIIYGIETAQERFVQSGIQTVTRRAAEHLREP